MRTETITRDARIQEILDKYNEELKIVENVLANPFVRSENYEKLRKLSSYLDYQGNWGLAWLLLVFAYLMYGLLIFQLSIENVLILIVLLSFGIAGGLYINHVIKLVLFCINRRKELRHLIEVTHQKLNQ